MVKRISLFVMIFTICIFAENTAPAAATATHQPTHKPPVAAQDSVAVVPAPEGEVVEQVAPEAAPAPAEPVAVAPVAPSPAPAAAVPPAKETIIENPIEFAIVSIVFLATVLLITLTGD